MLQSLLSAMQFLTILPIKITPKPDKRVLGNSLIYFPLVGLFLGSILAAADYILVFAGLGQIVINIILVIILAIMTGGLHLDGLADTTDAFAGGKNKEEILRIMRDPHIGTMGVLSLIGIILMKIALLTSLPAHTKLQALLLICIVSRWAMVLLMFVFAYAREQGKAKVFIQGNNTGVFAYSTCIALWCVTIVWGWKGILLLGIIAFSAYVLGHIVKGKIGGMTGDTIGGIGELTEVIALACVFILTST